MNTKVMMCCAASLAAAALMASDTPEVFNVLMSQASTGRRVTITYELDNAPNGAVVTLDGEIVGAGRRRGAAGAHDAKRRERRRNAQCTMHNAQ